MAEKKENSFTFTTEKLETIAGNVSSLIQTVLKRFNRSNSEVIECFIEKDSVSVANNNPEIYFIKLHIKNEMGLHYSEDTMKNEVLPIMLKKFRQSQLAAERVNTEYSFLKEIQFYQQLIPAMESFVEQNSSQLLPDFQVNPWPKYFHAKLANDTDNQSVLITEDLKSQGFRVFSKNIGLDLEHSLLVMKTLARFHALSYALLLGNYSATTEKYPWLKDSTYSEGNLLTIVKETFQKVFENQEKTLEGVGEILGASNLKKLQSQSYLKEIDKLIGQPVKWPVICHGECWAKNIFFRYDKVTDKPIDLKFINFQNCRASSRAADIHYFFFTTLEPQVLNEKELELKQCYFKEFSSSVENFGIDLKGHELTWVNFMKEMEIYRYYGCVVGLKLAGVITLDAVNTPDLDDAMSDEALVRIKNIVVNHLPKCPQLRDVSVIVNNLIKSLTELGTNEVDGE